MNTAAVCLALLLLIVALARVRRVEGLTREELDRAARRWPAGLESPYWQRRHREHSAGRVVTRESGR